MKTFYRPRIKRQTIEAKIWNKKVELANVIIAEKGCTFKQAMAEVNFTLAYKRI